jgi:hypothetical protein
MFSSMISTSQSSGQSAATVASPSGGFTVRLVGRNVSTAHLWLQKLSGDFGLMSNSFIVFGVIGATRFPWDKCREYNRMHHQKAKEIGHIRNGTSGGSA